MNYHFLPNYDKEKSKAYTPLGIKKLLEESIKIKNGDIEAVFKDKHQNKNLIELYHASFLVLAIKKWLKKEYFIYPCDRPDTYFLDPKTNEAFPVEIMELYFYNKNFDGDYKKLANHIFKIKGYINFPLCHLLIASRLDVIDFNISKLCHEMMNLNWHFDRIWLSIYKQKLNEYTFFQILPIRNLDRISSINFNINTDKNLYY